MTETTLPTPKRPPPPSPLAGLGVAAVVISAIVGWVALGSSFFSESSLFAGFLIFLYWAKVEHLVVRRLPAAILGALVGIGISWATLYGATNYGGAGLAVGLSLLAIAIYLDIIERFPTLVNTSTMIFSIITAAPLVKFKVDWIDLSLATVFGGLYFFACVAAAIFIANKLAQMRS